MGWRRVAIALLLALPCAAAAQSELSLPPFDVERLALQPFALDSLVVGMGRVAEPGSYRLQLAAHYQRSPLVLRRSDEVVGAVIRDRITTHLTAGYSLLRDLELGLSLPIIVHQAGDDLSALGVDRPRAAGVGAPTVSARYQLLGPQYGSPVQLAAGLGLGLPVASARALAGDERLVLRPRVSTGVILEQVSIGLELGANLRPSAELTGVTVGNDLSLEAAVASRGAGLRGELVARTSYPLSGGPVAAEVLAGGRVPIGAGFEALLLGGPGLLRSPGTPAFRVLAAIAWGGRRDPKRELSPSDPCRSGEVYVPAQCPELDLDGDGILNKHDVCPDVPEDRDGFRDDDGCADLDNDDDSIPDVADQCPLEEGEVEYGGCPPPDRDKDGVLDAQDECPLQPGPAARQGCPVQDQDGDGLEDEVDACPKEAGPTETRGCPIRDTDLDGVPDHVDNCPSEPGSPNNQGCRIKQLVVITPRALQIKDKVYFGTGKAEILPRSFLLLDQIAHVLQSHPEIPLVRIDGHTDDRGGDERNLELSQARADAVLGYLVRRGVDASRLQAKGFGPAHPADTNETVKGRENNRRVEFTIPGRAGED